MFIQPTSFLISCVVVFVSKCGKLFKKAGPEDHYVIFLSDFFFKFFIKIVKFLCFEGSLAVQFLKSPITSWSSISFGNGHKNVSRQRSSFTYLVNHKWSVRVEGQFQEYRIIFQNTTKWILAVDFMMNLVYSHNTFTILIWIISSSYWIPVSILYDLIIVINFK